MQHLQGSKLTFVFQSTPSVWRETGQHVVYAIVSIFQSTPSVWRETTLSGFKFPFAIISIHSLRVEGDPLKNCVQKSV